MRYYFFQIVFLLFWSFQIFSDSLSVVFYGDTRSQPFYHQLVLDAFATHEPDLVFNMGDIWLEYTDPPESTFLAILRSDSIISMLVDSNKYLVSRGNHETVEEVLNFKPPIVRNNSIDYSFREDNSFFICAGYEPDDDLVWIEQELKSVASQTAIWRFVYFHRPVYSSGTSHPNSGIAAFEVLCDKYDVTMVFNGHEHIYERTFLLRDAAVVSKMSDIDINQDSGTVYVITGGGGAYLSNIGSVSNWWCADFAKTYHFCLIDCYNDRIEFSARTRYDTRFDQLILRKSPYISFVFPVDTIWHQETFANIYWQSNCSGSYKIELFHADTLVTVITDSTIYSESFKWYCPNSIPSDSNYLIRVTLREDTTIFSEAFVSILPELIVTKFPFFENFDLFNSGETRNKYWVQESEDSLDWKICTGKTPANIATGNTGPTEDHTTGSGSYFYVNSADDDYTENIHTILKTPCFNLDSLSKPTLTFWGHMFSSVKEMGTLILAISTDDSLYDSVAIIFGDQGDEWFSHSLDLLPYVSSHCNFVFTAIAGTNSNSDISIDDFIVNDLPQFTTSPESVAVVSEVYYYAIAAVDRDSEDTIIIDGIQIPTWLKLINTGNGTAYLEGTPDLIHEGTYCMRISADDGYSIEAEVQEFNLHVKRNTVSIVKQYSAMNYQKKAGLFCTPNPIPLHITKAEIRFISPSLELLVYEGSLKVYDALGNTLWSDGTIRFLSKGRSVLIAELDHAIIAKLTNHEAIAVLTLWDNRSGCVKYYKLYLGAYSQSD